MLSGEILDFEVPFQGTLLQGSRWAPPEVTHTALVLHGGGTSSAEGFGELRSFLHARNIATLAFDAVGHGRTGGAQLGTTLEERVQQVITVVQAQGLAPESLALVGFSMGAYVAVKAAAELGVPRLCLAIPAAYATQAYQVPFGPQFSQILRTPDSWVASDAFDLVADYPGHLLVLSAEEDRVVPPEIPHTYLSCANKSASRQHHIIRRAGHKLSEHYAREPASREQAYAAIAALCRSEGEGTR
jgi:uncharacterized protein